MSHAATLSRPADADIDILWYVVVIALTALVLALQTWGLVVLTMIALPMVPVMFFLIIVMSRP